MLTTFQASWLLAGFAASALVNATGYLWTQRVNSRQAFLILWVLLGVSGAAVLLGALAALAVPRRRVWPWAAWFTSFAIGAAGVIYVWEFGLFAIDWTFALTVAVVSTALVLGLLAIVVDDWRRNRAAKVASSTSQRRDAHDTNVCSLSGALAVACALVLCGLGAAMFADVLLEFQKLPASDPLKKLAGLVQWIVVGIAGGTVLALAVWFFAAGARDAMREDAGGRGKKGKASQPSPVARTQPQMAGRPDDYVMAATAQMAPATLPPTTAIAQPLPAAASLAAASGTPSTGAVAAAPPQAPAATPTPGVRTMTCVRNYRAVEKDELTLTVGDKVMVITEYLDGWALGRHLPRNGQAGVEGVFPLICMA